MTASTRRVPLVCPWCGGQLRVGGDGASCGNGHVAPVVAGVLDCRGRISGYDIDGDRRLAEDLAATDDSYEAALRHYWSRQPDVASELVGRFVRGDVIGLDRAREVAAQIAQLVGVPLDPSAVVVEVGGGTAALATALAPHVGDVVATDISLAWLVLARRRIDEAGIDNVTLVAATADRLPVATDSVDLVVAADVIEHVPDAHAMVAECYRVLRPGAALWLSTPNRTSLTPEPHVRVWGVGLLPRPLGRRLVQRVRGVPYDDIRTLSVLALRRILRATGGEVRICAPAIATAVRDGYKAPARRGIDAYHLVRRLPLARRALLAITPLFHATVIKPSRADA